MNKTDIEIVSSIHNGPEFLPISQNDETRRLIFYVALAVTIFHLLLLSAIRKCMKNKNHKVTMKASYQGTNLCINAFLGIYGIYHYNRSLPPLSDLSIDEKITGYDQFISFGALQVGYNLWALPLGLFIIGESKTMLVHHVAAIFVAGLSSFFNSGFRYHAPFMFGVMEISSVPLSIVNYLRDNHEWAKENCG